MSSLGIAVTHAKKSFSHPSTVTRKDGSVTGFARKGGSKRITVSWSSIFTSNIGAISFLAMASGSKISQRPCNETAMEATKPSITTLLTKSTYAFQEDASFETFKASFESLTNLWISLPPSPIAINFMPTRSLCFRSNSSMATGFAPFARDTSASWHHDAKTEDTCLRFPFRMSTTAETSLTTFIVCSMNSGIRSSFLHCNSVRPGARAVSIFWMRSSTSGSSTGSSSVRTALYIVTMWSSCATQCLYVEALS
mmetsp:Transcript_4516/g.13037  ORF Transcript_4516/g.13037 Transcript_4516/m.13037 type:complete len:253 (-) Transcript_4516:2118-2876(-)